MSESDKKFLEQLEVLRPALEAASAPARAGIAVATQVIFGACKLVTQACTQTMTDKDLLALSAFLRGIALTCTGTCEDIEREMLGSMGTNAPSTGVLQ